MARINPHYSKLQASYLFSEIKERTEKFIKETDSKPIRMGIGDVTRPLTKTVINAWHKAVDEMAHAFTFRGYGPEQGYEFLREAITDKKYKQRGVEIASDEIFISDGAKCDTANVLDILARDNIAAVPDPVYPVYRDTNVMDGRTGEFNPSTEGYDGIVYMPCTAKNDFIPELPKQKVDLIYLCSPNNPTGATMTHDQLKKWVDFANDTNALILFDSAYESFVSDASLPRSIYEIKGAKKCAIESGSFSKSHGFTGTRLGWLTVPKELTIEDSEPGQLNAMWSRRQGTKFNGVSYPIQRAGEAALSREGLKESQKLIDFYMENAKKIKKTLNGMGIQTFGGVHSPYVFMVNPNGIPSWDMFDKVLFEAGVVGTPGAGFGKYGEGHFRFSSFNTRENTEKAMHNIETKLKL